jgi:hypothetical protein
VALLTPLPTGSRLQQLRASGKLTPAVRPWDALPPPISLRPGEKTASELLEELRAGER